MNLTKRQFWVLLALTLVWGLNWPVMKAGVSGLPGAPHPFPPLSFRALSMLMGLPVLAAALRLMGVPLALPRGSRAAVLRLALPNMTLWHVVVIIGVAALSSGRAAILGYTMPVFAALWGAFVFGEQLKPRQWLGVAAAATGVLLLLGNEFSRLAGAPLAAAAIVAAAACWAFGTHMLRRSQLPVPLLTVVFWMTAFTAAVMVVLATLFERGAWRAPEAHVWAAVAYNGVLVFGFAHAAWFYLARTMPPVASGISVMLIPVLGVFSGAYFLGEVLRWQDFAAVALIVVAIAAVLQRPSAAKPGPAAASPRGADAV